LRLFLIPAPDRTKQGQTVRMPRRIRTAGPARAPVRVRPIARRTKSGRSAAVAGRAGNDSRG